MTPYYHVKMMIVDGTQLFVGSQNCSDPPLTDGNPLLQQREVGIIVTDPAAIARAQAVFVFDWVRSLQP
jgi:phosphatidylserine/phosphatidylglycerophosphate/cardiolipin synthase-like enzyme